MRRRKAQSTSAEAYEAIKESGLLGKLQLRVLEVVVNHGPITANEVNERLGGHGYHKRLSELQRFGVVHTPDSRKCTITGRRCMLWESTGQPFLFAVTNTTTG